MEVNIRIIVFRLFMKLETNFPWTMKGIFGSKVLLWEAGRPACWPGAGGIGTKTNSAQLKLELGLSLAKIVNTTLKGKKYHRK